MLTYPIHCQYSKLALLLKIVKCQVSGNNTSSCEEYLKDLSINEVYHGGKTLNIVESREVVAPSLQCINEQSNSSKFQNELSDKTIEAKQETNESFLLPPLKNERDYLRLLRLFQNIWTTKTSANFNLLVLLYLKHSNFVQAPKEIFCCPEKFCLGVFYTVIYSPTTRYSRDRTRYLPAVKLKKRTSSSTAMTTSVFYKSETKCLQLVDFVVDHRSECFQKCAEQFIQKCIRDLVWVSPILTSSIQNLNTPPQKYISCGLMHGEIRFEYFKSKTDSPKTAFEYTFKYTAQYAFEGAPYTFGYTLSTLLSSLLEAVSFYATFVLDIQYTLLMYVFLKGECRQEMNTLSIMERKHCTSNVELSFDIYSKIFHYILLEKFTFKNRTQNRTQPN
ncbi:hypothetical protein Bhyg_12174 [Pseudolycoriella hygida]|uniref:Uncharacterized protein n=1 Tax=Pseudolycoriella hygida TaxID=35572 RepID=A0A9Q0MY88_9DIPT|nr:hypothetical protein Bhyg_12174 [Pseudolycoriella hygida]